MAIPTIFKASSYNGPTVYNNGGGDDIQEEEINGIKYKVINANGKIWLAENLKYTDSNLVLNGNGDEKGYYYPNGDINNVEKYGYLYNLEAALYISSNIAGWHLANRTEWRNLADWIGCNNRNISGYYLKSKKEEWIDDPSTKTNIDIIDFSVLPAGSCSMNFATPPTITYNSFNLYAFFWTTTVYSSGTNWYSQFEYNDNRYIDSYNGGNLGYSLRLVKD